MNDTLKKMTEFTIILLVILSLFSCEDSLLDNMVKDKVYLLQKGVHPAEIMDFDEAIYPLYVFKSGAGQMDLTLTIEIEERLITEYNAANGTEYKMMGEAAYVIKNRILNMNKEDYQKPFEFTFNKEVLQTLADDPDSYAIPCRISVSNRDHEELDIDQMEVLLVPTLKAAYIQFQHPGMSDNSNVITAKDENELWYYSEVNINYPAHYSVSFELELDYELLERYNSDHGSDYKPLPDVAIQFDRQWTIPQFGEYIELNFKLFKEKMKSSDGQLLSGEYVLPLRIKDVSRNRINPEKGFQFIVFSIHE